MNIHPPIHTNTSTQIHIHTEILIRKHVDESDESGRGASVITVVTTATTIIINIVVNIQLTITYLVLDIQVRTSLCQSYGDVLVTPRRGQY